MGLGLGDIFSHGEKNGGQLGKWTGEAPFLVATRNTLDISRCGEIL